MQTVGHNPVGIARNIALALHDCIADFCHWCSTKRLQLNAEKTEVMWLGTTGHLNWLCAGDKRITVGHAVIEPSNVARDLGALFDAELSKHDHVARPAQAFLPFTPSALHFTIVWPGRHSAARGPATLQPSP
jgi:hypothetical protein